MAAVEPIGVAVIGAGWVGGIRARACAKNPLVELLQVAEIDRARAASFAEHPGVTSVTDDYTICLSDDSIDAVIVASTPEGQRYEIVRAALEAGKHVLVEKPIAPTPQEADEAIHIAEAHGLKFSVGYTRRFDPKYAYVNKAVKEGMIGDPVSCFTVRTVTREIGAKIRGRTKMSPASMGATHSFDFMLWSMQPRLPVTVYSQQAGKLFSQFSETPDYQWTMVTMDDGTILTAGGGWILPLGHPLYSQSYIEVIGTEGALTVDDTHREVQLNTVENGIRFPMSTMPGEQVDHVFAGAMVDETDHFIEAVAHDLPVLVTAREARLVMDVTMAADRSAETGEVIRLDRLHD